MGASRHPVFPAPSFWKEGKETSKARAEPAARTRGRVYCLESARGLRRRFNASLRGAKRRSNPDCRRGGILDCFASLAMTEKRAALKSITLMPRRPPDAAVSKHEGHRRAFLLRDARCVRTVRDGLAIARPARVRALPATMASPLRRDEELPAASFRAAVKRMWQDQG